MKDIVYWIWFSLLSGAGSSDGVRLLERYDYDPIAVYEAEPDELGAIEELPRSFLRRFENKSLASATSVIEFCFMNEIRPIPCVSDEYPKRLSALENKPTVLYARGRISDLDDRLCVAVVGTRSMTDYGKHVTFDIVRNLCARGVIVVSGAAYGIDSVANNTAVFFESETIAVLGSGINVPYPRENAKLLDRIAANGIVFSEFAPGTSPTPLNFPIRNRIISGLCDAVLVVEADEKSGALITARYAITQNREVYAVPGDVDRRNSRGTNQLIREGAKLCTSADDILADFAELYDLSRVERIASSEEYIRYEQKSRQRLAYFADEDTRKRSKVVQSKPTKAKSAKSGEKSDENETATETKPHRADEGTASVGTVAKTKSTPPTRESRAVSESKPETRESKSPEKALALTSAERDRLISKLDATQKRVLESFPNADAISPDKLTSSGLETREILASLTVLELFGTVEALPGGLYRKLI